MRWGRKKPSASRSSATARALPVPWIWKFKGMNINGSHSKPTKEKQHNVSARFQGDNGDASWRLAPAGEERFKGGSRRGVIQSEQCKSGDGFDFPAASCRSCGSYVMRLMEVEPSEDVNKKRREICGYEEIFREIQRCEQEKETVIVTHNLQKDQKRVRKNQGVLQKKRTIPANPIADSRKYASAASKNIGDDNSGNLEEDSAFSAESRKEKHKPYPENFPFLWQNLKEMKIKEVKLQAEQQQRKSRYVSRELSGSRTKQNPKVRVLSPRTSPKAEKCRVRALEDMKKAKLKMKAEEQRATNKSIPESFAIMKCSFDPQKDFRDSMVEMILENRIQRPKELEELLVCYLTLNADEYHHLIIKVFRQVWYDLKHGFFEAEINNKRHTYDLSA